MAEKEFLLSANVTATATGLIWMYRIVHDMNRIPEKLETVKSKLEHCYTWELNYFLYCSFSTSFISYLKKRDYL